MLSQILLASALVLAWVPSASAAPRVPQKVVLAPISSLGAQPKSLKPVEALIESSVSKQGFQVISAGSAAKQANQQKRPELRSCEGNISCLTELGTLLTATFVIHAEVGGLGDAQVVYLKLVDVAAKAEIRSTTLELRASGNNEAAEAAMTRLLVPKRYVGTLSLVSTVDKATVYLDGHKVATTPTQAISVYVGSHALRITHPEHHDFVRFVDVAFGKETKVEVELREVAGVNRSLAKKNILDPETVVVSTGETPWYRRWYTITGGAVVVGVTAAIIIGVTSSGIDAEATRELGQTPP